MNSPLKVFDKTDPVLLAPERRKAEVISINSDNNHLIERLSTSSVAVALGDFRHSSDYRDSKVVDYLLIGVLSILIHTIVVDHFKHSPLEAEQVEPVKPPSKVQISFVRPTPPPPKVVQPPPPPPPPKVVAIKKPPKPKVTPKPTPKPVVVPQPVHTTNVDTHAPVITAPPAPSTPPPPPAPKPVEKVTQPRGSAGYLNNPTTDYPEVAAERGWEGRVVLKVHVLASGKPDTVSVASSSGHDVLDSEAVSTVKKWTFAPAKRGTTPIDGWVNVPISFKLS